MSEIPVLLPGATRNDRLACIKEKLRPHRTRLCWIVDALIPADPLLEMPSASEALVVDLHLPEALLFRDDLQAQFFAILDSLPDIAPAQALQTLEALGGKRFDLVCRIVAGAFFLDKQVNNALGYTAQKEIRENPDYDYLMQAIEPVISRGEVYTKI